LSKYLFNLVFKSAVPHDRKYTEDTKKQIKVQRRTRESESVFKPVLEHPELHILCLPHLTLTQGQHSRDSCATYCKTRNKNVQKKRSTQCWGCSRTGL